MRRKGIQLAYPFEEKRLAKWEPPYLVQPKLDGVRCRAVFHLDCLHLLSSEENRVISVPHIKAALYSLRLPLSMELDGELYVHGMNFENVNSIVSRTKNLHPDHKVMQYHIFDIINMKPQMERSVDLIGLTIDLGSDSPIKSVHTVPAKDFDEVMETYDKFIEQGYEGMIVRHKGAPYIRRRSTHMMKFKPKKKDIYRIVGWKEEISIGGEPKGRLGALICVGDDGTTFGVGSGLTDRSRESLWDTRVSLKGRFCEVQYQHITSGKNVPRFPIFVKVLDPTEFDL